MQGLYRFLAGMTGRWVRIIAGIVLIALGLFVVTGAAGYILAVIGLLPLAAGVFDVCIFAPFFGLPFNGSHLRSKLS